MALKIGAKVLSEVMSDKMKVNLTKRDKFCSVYSCKNVLLNQNVTYHTFPKNYNRFVEWITAIGRLDLIDQHSAVIMLNMVVCGNHFDKNARNGNSKKGKLKPNAVPKIVDIKVPVSSSKISNNEDDFIIDVVICDTTPKNVPESIIKNEIQKEKLNENEKELLEKEIKEELDENELEIEFLNEINEEMPSLEIIHDAPELEFTSEIKVQKKSNSDKINLPELEFLNEGKKKKSSSLKTINEVIEKVVNSKASHGLKRSYEKSHGNIPNKRSKKATKTPKTNEAEPIIIQNDKEHMNFVDIDIQNEIIGTTPVVEPIPGKRRIKTPKSFDEYFIFDSSDKVRSTKTPKGRSKKSNLDLTPSFLEDITLKTTKNQMEITESVANLKKELTKAKSSIEKLEKEKENLKLKLIEMKKNNKLIIKKNKLLKKTCNQELSNINKVTSAKIDLEKKVKELKKQNHELNKKMQRSLDYQSDEVKNYKNMFQDLRSNYKGIFKRLHKKINFLSLRNRKLVNQISNSHKNMTIPQLIDDIKFLLPDHQAVLLIGLIAINSKVCDLDQNFIDKIVTYYLENKVGYQSCYAFLGFPSVDIVERWANNYRFYNPKLKSLCFEKMVPTRSENVEDWQKTPTDTENLEDWKKTTDLNREYDNYSPSPSTTDSGIGDSSQSVCSLQSNESACPSPMNDNVLSPENDVASTPEEESENEPISNTIKPKLIGIQDLKDDKADVCDQILGDLDGCNNPPAKSQELQNEQTNLGTQKSSSVDLTSQVTENNPLDLNIQVNKNSSSDKDSQVTENGSSDLNSQNNSLDFNSEGADNSILDFNSLVPDNSSLDFSNLVPDNSTLDLSSLVPDTFDLNSPITQNNELNLSNQTAQNNSALDLNTQTPQVNLNGSNFDDFLNNLLYGSPKKETEPIKPDSSSEIPQKIDTASELAQTNTSTESQQQTNTSGPRDLLAESLKDIMDVKDFDFGTQIAEEPKTINSNASSFVPCDSDEDLEGADDYFFEEDSAFFKSQHVVLPRRQQQRRPVQNYTYVQQTKIEKTFKTPKPNKIVLSMNSNIQPKNKVPVYFKDLPPKFKSFVTEGSIPSFKIKVNSTNTKLARNITPNKFLGKINTSTPNPMVKNTMPKFSNYIPVQSPITSSYKPTTKVNTQHFKPWSKPKIVMNYK